MNYNILKAELHEPDSLAVYLEINFAERRISSRTFYERFQAEFSPERMEEIKLVSDICRINEWEDEYFCLMPFGTSWKVQLFRETKLLKESEGAGKYPEMWDVFESLLHYCDKLAKKHSDHRGGNHTSLYR